MSGLTRITSRISVAAMTLLVPALSAAQQLPDARMIPSRPLHAQTFAAVPAVDAQAQACRADAPPAEPETTDPRWQWRLRAYRHLECVTTLIDAALRRSGAAAFTDGENNPVPVAREDLERIRTLAWWARDAAARIGQ